MAGKVFTKEQILLDWKTSVKVGLGPTKKLEKSILVKHEPLLLAIVAKRLAVPANNYGKDRKNTKAVARTVGQICRILTEGSEVKIGVFEAVFDLCQDLHPKCPGAKGSGKWCG